MSMMGDDPKTLYVGNLSPQVTEEFMYVLFGQMGTCVSCKMIYEPGQDPYCFVEFADNASAAQSLNTMNGREVFGKPMRVNWATSPNSKNVSNPAKKVDTSDHFHIFCGDLSPDISTEQLREAFSAFGEISDCKVISDVNSGKSKGYGFISFVNKEDAQKSINEMNGAWLGSRAIRTNWATRKPPAPTEKRSGGGGGGGGGRSKLTYDDVYAQASETNCTVYIGGIQEGLHDELLRGLFSEHGRVEEVRCFAEKGFAFVRLDSKASAARAIVALNGQDVMGFNCRCAWGKESNDSQRSATGQNSNYGYGQAYAGQWGNNYGSYGYGYGAQQQQQQQWGQWNQQQWAQQQQQPQQWGDQSGAWQGYGNYNQQGYGAGAGGGGYQ